MRYVLAAAMVMLAGCKSDKDSEIAKLKGELAAKQPAAAPTQPAAVAPATPKTYDEINARADNENLGADAPGEMTGKWLAALLAQADANKAITYGQIKKSADKYTGKAWSLTGVIREISEQRIPGSTVVMTVGRVAMGNAYDEEPVYFIAPFTTDFVENSVVDIAGFLTGDFTYESQAGWNITIPSMAVRAMVKHGGFAKARGVKRRPKNETEWWKSAP